MSRASKSFLWLWPQLPPEKQSINFGSEKGSEKRVSRGERESCELDNVARRLEEVLGLFFEEKFCGVDSESAHYVLAVLLSYQNVPSSRQPSHWLQYF